MVGSEPGSVILWRIALSDPPTLDDFRSHQEKGILLRCVTADALRLWSGVSVYRTRQQAAALARVMPHLGQYLVALRVPTDGAILYELDNRKNGHCTVWAPAEDLHRLVVSIERL